MVARADKDTKKDKEVSAALKKLKGRLSKLDLQIKEIPAAVEFKAPLSQNRNLVSPFATPRPLTAMS